MQLLREDALMSDLKKDNCIKCLLRSYAYAFFCIIILGKDKNNAQPDIVNL